MFQVPTPSTLKQNKIIMILCDGMRADISFKEFGYVNSLCDNSTIGTRTTSIVDNPSVSKTNYETLHTGVPSLVHGITSNLITGKSKMERNIFRELSKAGKTTAIVGSSWFYDLYGKDKYLYLKHKELNKENGEDITYGRFFSDDCPDAVDDSSEGLAHTFQISDFLVYKYNPDYLLIHVMTPDNVGHSKGVEKEYSKAISKIDSVLGATLPRWFDMGYDIVITSDHGMDTNHNHGGSKCDEMTAPMYILSKKGWLDQLGQLGQSGQLSNDNINHIDVAGLILDRLLPNNNFKEYRDQLIKDSDFKHNNSKCVE